MDNLIVDRSSQPYIFDLEESGISDEPVDFRDRNFTEIRNMFKWNVQAHLKKSENFFVRQASRFPIASNLIAHMFFEGPVKRTYGGW